MSKIRDLIVMCQQKEGYLFRSEMDRVRAASAELTEMQVRIEKLEMENAVMYAAILEASELGISAALRCKVELQRIARNEAKE